MNFSLDSLLKTGLFLLTPWLLNLLVSKATGAALFESMAWQFRNLSLAHKPMLAFGLLAALVFSALAFSIANNFYQSLVSRKEPALLLGYHHEHEHYLGGDEATPIPIAILRDGPGPQRFNLLYQRESVMYNRISGEYWALRDIKSSPWNLLLLLAMLLFVLPTLGYGHVMFLDTIRPELLKEWYLGAVRERDYAKIFIQGVFQYLAARPVHVGIVLAALGGALALQATRLQGERQLATTPVPSTVHPGAVLSATLVDTYRKTTSSVGDKRSLLSDAKFDSFYYFAVFEIKGLYPHPVWLAAMLGGDKSKDKDDGAYSSADSTLANRVDYESATALFESLQSQAAARPVFKVGVTEYLTLDWTVDPSFK